MLGRLPIDYLYQIADILFTHQGSRVAFKPMYAINNADELVALLKEQHTEGRGVIKTSEIEV